MQSDGTQRFQIWRRARSVLAIVLGGLGFTLNLVVILAIWVSLAWVNGGVNNTLVEVDAFLTDVEAEVDELTTYISGEFREETTGAVLEVLSDDVIDEAARERVLAILRDELLPAIIEIDATIAQIETYVNRAAPYITLAASLLPEETVNALTTEAVTTLTEVRSRVSVLRASLEAAIPDEDEVAQRAEAQLDALVTPVSELDDLLRELPLLVEEVGAEFDVLQETVEGYIGRVLLILVLVAVVLSLLFGWLGWAQWTLLRSGMSDWRAKPVSTLDAAS